MNFRFFIYRENRFNEIFVNRIGGVRMKYLPLAYMEKYESLTNLYCSDERCNCGPEILLDMIADDNWGTSDYAGPNKKGYDLTFDMISKNFWIMQITNPCFAIAGFAGVWKYNKTVYEPDYDFSKVLLGTKKLRVYPHMIKYLPFNTFYLDFSKNQLFEYSGFFVNVKVYDSGTIRIISLPTESDFSHIPVENYEQEPSVYADTFWIKSEKFNIENGISYFDYDFLKDDMWTSDSYKTQWFVGGISNFRLFLLQFLMYLSSKEPDIIESPDTINTYKPSQIVRNKYSEVRKWDVGCRYGAKIRNFEKREHNYQSGISDNSNQGTKRPHIRKAHWERYRIGKGRKEIITKWKEPIFVNGDSDDIIANIHIVTDKEAECSSGEELIKPCLKSLNITYDKEHYIKEIRKRFDFALLAKEKLVFIEFDGEQHFKPINRWKGKRGYIERRKADTEKNEYCQKHGIPLLRIRYDQAVMIPEMIKDFLENTDKYYQKFNTYLSNEIYYSICK